MGQSTSAEEVGRNLHHHISLAVKHAVKMYRGQKKGPWYYSRHSLSRFWVVRAIIKK
jgi:hypothetical protein